MVARRPDWVSVVLVMLSVHAGWRGVLAAVHPGPATHTHCPPHVHVSPHDRPHVQDSLHIRHADDMFPQESLVHKNQQIAMRHAVDRIPQEILAHKNQQIAMRHAVDRIPQESLAQKNQQISNKASLSNKQPSKTNTDNVSYTDNVSSPQNLNTEGVYERNTGDKNKQTLSGAFGVGKPSKESTKRKLERRATHKARSQPDHMGGALPDVIAQLMALAQQEVDKIQENVKQQGGLPVRHEKSEIKATSPQQGVDTSSLAHRKEPQPMQTGDHSTTHRREPQPRQTGNHITNPTATFKDSDDAALPWTRTEKNLAGPAASNSTARQYTRSWKSLAKSQQAEAVESGKSLQAETVGSGKSLQDGAVGSGKSLQAETVGSGKSLQDGAVGSGKSLQDGAVGSGKNLQDGAVGSGKSLQDGAVGSGKSLQDGVVGSGKSLRAEAVGSGKSLQDGAVGSGKSLQAGAEGSGESLQDGAVGSGKSLQDGAEGSGESLQDGAVGSGKSLQDGAVGSGKILAAGAVGSGKILQAEAVGSGKSLQTEAVGSGNSSLSGGVQGVGCLSQFLASRTQLSLGKRWAQVMADSTAHMGSGMMDNEMDFLGVRGECLRVPLLGGFPTQYCVVTFAFGEQPFPMAMKTSQVTGLSAGLCAPESCEDRDMEWIINLVASSHSPVRGLHVDTFYCSREEDTGLAPATITAITVLGLWGMLILGATVLLSCREGASPSSPSQPPHPPRATPQPPPSPPQPPLSPYQPASSQSPPRATPPPPPRPQRREPYRAVAYHPTIEEEDDQAEASDACHSITIRTDTETDSEIVSIPDSDRLSSVPSLRRSSRTEEKEKIRGILRGNPKGSLPLVERSEVKTSRLMRAIRCLSLQQNVQGLLAVSPVEAELGCLHGIRVLSVSWAVLVNSVMYQCFFVRNVWRLFLDWRHNQVVYPLIGNGLLSLDSLFAVSGLLVGYSCCLKPDRNHGVLSWLALVFRRYWRVVPTMVVVGLSYVALFPALTDGPLSVRESPEQAACVRWGWMHLLLVNNLAPSACMSWTWFQAVDFQLFLLALGVLAVLHRWPRLACLLVLALVVGCGLVSGVLTHVHDLPVTQFVLPQLDNITSDFARSDRFVTHYFHTPWAHAGAFLPPLLLGHYLQSSGRRASFRPWVLGVGWLLAAASSAAVIWGAGKDLVGERALPRAVVALYNGVQRTVWGLCISWLVLMCSTGHAPRLNVFLSWPRWKPLSRLVFPVYLLHPVLLLAFNASLEQLPSVSVGLVVWRFVIVLGYSLLLAAVLFITVHRPITSLLPRDSRH